VKSFFRLPPASGVIVATVSTAGCLALLLWAGFFDKAEFLTRDLRFQLREKIDRDHHFDPRVRVVGITDPDLNVVGQWPWDRRFHGELVSLLSAAGADAIAFDLLFVEPGNDPDSDLAFASATAEAANVIVGAERILQKGMPSGTLPKPITRVVGDFTESEEEDKVQVALMPFPGLAAVAKTGFVNADADADGGRRELPLVLKVRGEYYPGLATQTLMTYWKIDADDLELHLGDRLIFHTAEGPRSAPIDDEGKMIVNLRSTTRFLDEGVYSYIDLYRALSSHLQEGEPWNNNFGAHPAGRIFVVAQVAPGLSDMGPTAFDPLTPLCYLQAQAISNILQNDFVCLPPMWLCFLVWTIIVSTLLIITKGASLRRIQLIPIFAVVLYLLGGLLIFAFQGILVPVIWPIAGYVSLQAASAFRGWQRDHDAKIAIDASLRAAAEIQLSTLPSADEINAGISQVHLSAVLIPAQDASGDFYDFFSIDDDHLALVIADVCDKGITAATFMLQAKTLLKSEVKGSVHLPPESRTPGAIFERANDELAERNTKSMFATAFLGIYEISTGLLSYSTAGHYPPILFSEADAPEELPGKQNLALGLMEGMHYDTLKHTLPPGSSVLLYTDGVTEAFDASSDMFGTERLINTLNNCRTSKQAVTELQSQLAAFTNGAQQSDDITVVALSRVK